MRRQSLYAARALAAFASVFSCRTEQTLVRPEPHLERMLDQEKVLAYSESPVFKNGAAMQVPPEGTLPTTAQDESALAREGESGGTWASRIPVPMDRALVDRGREAFETFCAACHGILGDGHTVVAEKMALRKPPSLHEARLRSAPPGQIYATIRQGYGLMPGYSVQLPVRDAWGVVAYVKALQLARGARVRELPESVRAELAREAP